jgi:preprotein translocase subunit SecE
MAVEKASPRDNFLLVVGLAIVAAGIAGFFYYADEVMTIIRAVGLVVAVVVASLVVLQTQRGRDMFGFVREADEQRRKVVWPTRQETFQTTLIVIVLTIITAILLFLMDSVFGWLIRRLIGTAGGN